MISKRWHVQISTYRATSFFTPSMRAAFPKVHCTMTNRWYERSLCKEAASVIASCCADDLPVEGCMREVLLGFEMRDNTCRGNRQRKSRLHCCHCHHCRHQRNPSDQQELRITMTSQTGRPRGPDTRHITPRSVGQSGMHVSVFAPRLADPDWSILWYWFTVPPLPPLPPGPEYDEHRAFKLHVPSGCICGFARAEPTEHRCVELAASNDISTCMYTCDIASPQVSQQQYIGIHQVGKKQD